MVGGLTVQGVGGMRFPGVRCGEVKEHWMHTSHAVAMLLRPDIAQLSESRPIVVCVDEGQSDILLEVRVAWAATQWNHTSPNRRANSASFFISPKVCFPYCKHQGKHTLGEIEACTGLFRAWAPDVTRAVIREK